MKILLDQLIPNPEQPRLAIDQVELQSLADSIQEHGLLNPISVEGPLEDGRYIILDGERRWRAHRLAGLTEIEAYIARFALNGSGKVERLLLGIVGNLQRQDLNVIERATAYRRLKDLGMTYAEIAKSLGIHQSVVPQSLKLLELPVEVQDLFAAGKLPIDNRVIYAFLAMDPQRASRLAAQAAARGYPARRIVALAGRLSVFEPETRPARPEQAEVARSNKIFAAKAEFGHWNALAQLRLMRGKEMQIDSYLKAAAIETCQACALYEDASQNVCRDCPAVELIRRLQS